MNCLFSTMNFIVEPSTIIMKLFRISFQIIIASCLLFIGTSCEKSEKEEIQEKQKEVSSKKASTTNTHSNEKANVDDMTPYTYYGRWLGCLKPDNLCTRTVIVTPSIADDQRRLNDAMDEGAIEDLEPELLERLFQDLKDRHIEALISGETDICRTYSERKEKTFYIAHDPEVKCAAAKERKDLREWVYPLADQR
jgi:hypothetical protein